MAMFEYGFEGEVGGPYGNPPAGMDYGCEGDCRTNSNISRSGSKSGMVNHVGTKGTSYPGPGTKMSHMGIVALAKVPRSSGYVGLASMVPAQTLSRIGNPQIGPGVKAKFIELGEFTPSNGTPTDPRPVSVRLYVDGRLALGVFGRAADSKTSWTVEADRWFYTVTRLRYGAGVDLWMDVYDENDVQVDRVEGKFDTVGGTEARLRQKVGGETQLGTWPEEYPTFHDDWYISASDEGARRG